MMNYVVIEDNKGMFLIFTGIDGENPRPVIDAGGVIQFSSVEDAVLWFKEEFDKKENSKLLDQNGKVIATKTL